MSLTGTEACIEVHSVLHTILVILIYYYCSINSAPCFYGRRTDDKEALA